MKPYLTLVIGWMIGQLTFTVVAAYILQRNKEIDYWDAVRIFLKKEQGNYVMAIMALVIALFIYTDYIDISIKRADLLDKDVLTFSEKLIYYLRSYSIVFGVFCQFVLLMLFKRGIRGINEIATQNKITVENELNKTGINN